MALKTSILFVLPTAGTGGAERVTIGLLRRLDPARFQATLLLLAREGEYLDSVPSHVEIRDLGGLRARNALFPLVRTIRRSRPDIVFSTHAYINILCLVASFFVNSRVAFFARHPIMPDERPGRDGTSALRKRLLRLLYPRARRVIAQTHAMRDAMVEIFGLPEEKIDVLINPVDRELIDGMVQGATSPFEPGTVNFVAAGRLVPQKGFDTLLEAFRTVHREIANARLCILGEGPGRADLERRIREHGLSAVVRMPGFMSNPYPYFKHADIYVLSSRFEGLPNTVLEALHLGTPCVATRCIPFMADIIQEPDNGALVDVDDPAALADKLLQRDAYRLAPERLERSGTVDVETLFDPR